MNVAWRPTSAEIDLDAVRANVAAFVGLAAPAKVCAVVKADGYGHGAVACAESAVAGGAEWLAVALVEEAVELRLAGIGAPILLLSEFPDAAVEAVVRHGITPTVYSAHRLGLLAEAARAMHPDVGMGVHIKVDTGMHRVGVQPQDLLPLARLMDRSPNLAIGGVYTHFAMADVPSDPFTQTQLARFADALHALRAEGIDPGIVHAANSAGALTRADARFDMVRVGIALYGNDPDGALPAVRYGVELQPVLTLRSAVTHVKVLRAGERLSYGLHYTLGTDAVVATVPIGYADGLARRYSAVGGQVLLHGRRCNIAGRITMDQILVDCGPPDAGDPVRDGDEVVLLGQQGPERITPWEMATRLDTIAYEVTCAISQRVPRVYRGRSS